MNDKADGVTDTELEVALSLLECCLAEVNPELHDSIVSAAITYGWWEMGVYPAENAWMTRLQRANPGEAFQVGLSETEEGELLANVWDDEDDEKGPVGQEVDWYGRRWVVLGYRLATEPNMAFRGTVTLRCLGEATPGLLGD